MQRLGKIQNPFSRQNSVVPNLYKRQHTVHNPMFDGIEEVEDDGETLELPNNFKTQKSCAF